MSSYSRSGSKANATKTKYRPYAAASSVSAAHDKLRVGVPDDLKVVYLDVQDGTKVQPFQENLHAFSNYAGSNIDDGGAIGEFILNLEEAEMMKPDLPTAVSQEDGGTGVVDRTDEKIWEGECSAYVRARSKRKESLAKMYNIIWGCCTLSMRGKLRTSPGFKDTDVPGWGPNKNPIELLKAVQALTYRFDTYQYDQMALMRVESCFMAFHQSRTMTVEFYEEEIERQAKLIEQLGGAVGYNPAFIHSELA